MTRKGNRGTNLEMFSLEMKSPSFCFWNRPGIEREMLSLVSAEPFLLAARRKGKARSSMVSADFYGTRGGVPGQNSIGHSNWMKCIISKLKRQNQFPH